MILLFPLFCRSARFASLLLIIAPSFIANAQTKPPVQQWASFHSQDSKDCQFSVLLPAKPEITKDHINPSPEDTFWVWTYKISNTRAAYILSCTISPSYLSSRGRESSMLDQQLDEAIRSVKGNLVDKKTITVSGFPGRAFVFTFTANKLRFVSYSELILTERTLYQLSVTIPTDYITVNKEQDVDHFFNSFALESN